MTAEHDYYSDVPLDLAGNLAFRLDLRRRCAKSASLRAAVMEACRTDVMFWLAAFCWLYEPRVRFDDNGRRLPKQIPFIPWDHQPAIIREIKKNLGVIDIGVEKSRGEGLSWIALLLALHDWLFNPLSKVGIVSRNEAMADTPGNMDSLLAKLDWELTKLPKWMVGTRNTDWCRNRADHSLVNLRNDAQINAFASTADAGHAGRYEWFFCDEMALWDAGKDTAFLNGLRETTYCRLVVSTPQGPTGAYYEFMHNPSGAIVRIRVHWSQNNSKNRGLYKLDKEGVPIATDPENKPLPSHYSPPSQDVLDLYSRLRAKGFVLGARLRSPWYDQQCDRADATPKNIAQELDIDYAGSMYRYFREEFMQTAESTIQTPQSRGDITYNPEDLDFTFDRSANGPLKIWCALDHKNKPPRRQYALGADVGTGLGGSHTSNSTVVVIDLLTGEQVAEFVSNTMGPNDFTDYCICLANMFHGAYLAWENNMIGGVFTKRILDRGYPDIYMRTILHKRSKNRTKEAGWRTTPQNRPIMFAAVYNDVKKEKLIVRSDAILAEFGQYVYIGGKIKHIGAERTDDDSAKGEAHGDRVIALCVAWQAAKDRPLPEKLPEAPTKDPPVDTLAFRDQMHENARSKGNSDWDETTNESLASGRNF
jgi:hypothetical protein